MTQIQLKAMPIGAEVVELAPEALEDPAVTKALYDAWLEHGLLLFRGVKSIRDHLAYSAAFGEPELHPMPNMRDPEEPLLMPLGDDIGAAMVYEEGVPIRGRLAWHRDTAYTQGIAKGGMLRLRIVPDEGGETLFADTALAYESLSEEMKQRLDGLEYKADFTQQFRPESRGRLWTSERPATEAEVPGNDAAVQATEEGLRKLEFPAVVHPVVAKHPESGRTCLFISPKDTECIIGLSDSESDELLNELVAHMTDERFTYEHDWQVDDAMVWDNRRMLHAAAGYPTRCHRKGQRTTLTGRFALGRIFDPATDRNPVPTA
jgi:taurine dioxygenase